MGIGGELQELGAFLQECERRGEAVTGVELAGVTDAGDARLSADVELTLSVDPSPTGGASLRDPRIGPDGTVRFALESTTDLVPSTDRDVGVDPTDVSLDADGTLTVTLAATVPAGPDGVTDGVGVTSTPAATATGPSVTPVPDDEGDPRPAGERTDRGREASTDGRDREVPPFRDPDLLAEVYEANDTFAAMADALEMDVTAETVRRYMIDFDIHEPDSYETGGSDAGEADADARPVVLPDGIGLPDDVTVDTLVETVKRSNTIYEVTRDVDLDRQDALEMLQDLNLLDLVVGRLATEGERDISREDIVDRLREASAVQ